MMKGNNILWLRLRALPQRIFASRTNVCDREQRLFLRVSIRDKDSGILWFNG